MVLSTALFDRPPFLNCICHGVILDSTGQKLSKRLNNYADPLELFDKYGSDALRVTMLSSNVVKGQELLIDKEGKMVFDSLRLFVKPIWNAYHFFCLYANLDSIKAEQNTSSKNILDRYILSKLKSTVQKIECEMDRFDTVESYAAISSFFELLNNWLAERQNTGCSISIEKTSLAGRKILVYAGNMGVAQDVGKLIDLANRFKDNDEMGFLFVGRGDKAAALKEYAISLGLRNILFFDEIFFNSCHFFVIKS
jgi:valyl-tRNA synthetase